jgi:hypothetical protein
MQEGIQVGRENGHRNAVIQLDKPKVKCVNTFTLLHVQSIKYLKVLIRVIQMPKSRGKPIRNFRPHGDAFIR